MRRAKGNVYTDESVFSLNVPDFNYTPDGGWQQSICLVMKGANVLLVKSKDGLVHRELNKPGSKVKCNVSFMVKIPGESCIQSFSDNSFSCKIL